jgi:hypothetical protein
VICIPLASLSVESLVVAYIRSSKYAIWATARRRFDVVSSFLVVFCWTALLLPVRSFRDEIWVTARRRLDVVSNILVVTLPLFSICIRSTLL